jgi:hypothetical protein
MKKAKVEGKLKEYLEMRKDVTPAFQSLIIDVRTKSPARGSGNRRGPQPWFSSCSCPSIITHMCYNLNC